MSSESPESFYHKGNEQFINEEFEQAQNNFNRFSSVIFKE